MHVYRTSRWWWMTNDDDDPLIGYERHWRSGQFGSSLRELGTSLHNTCQIPMYIYTSATHASVR